MKKHLSLKKGFTLIELLVVIAIIALLAAIVLVSLNSARAKAKDAKIGGQLSVMRAQAELYYDTYGSAYGAGDCTSIEASTAGTASATNMFIRPANENGLWELAKAIENDNGTPKVVCGANATTWAASSQLVADSTKFWCVDSNGASRKQSTGAIGTGPYQCQ